MKSQKEINLGKDLEMRDRKDIYRNFLLFCVSGDVVQLPMGSTGRSSCFVDLISPEHCQSSAAACSIQPHTEWLVPISAAEDTSFVRFSAQRPPPLIEVTALHNLLSHKEEDCCGGYAVGQMYVDGCEW